MTYTWYVTFEVPRGGTLVRRRNPRLTKTFETEAEAKNFARIKFEQGLVVTAGTINPHLPRQAIAPTDIAYWLEYEEDQDAEDSDGAHERGNEQE
jgi:hypothetical protein